MRTLALAIALIGAAPASAEVVVSSETAFTSRHVLILAASPSKVWAALLHPERWWDSAHTWSGSAANLSLDPRPGGCWCEKTVRGGAEHMRVVYLAADDTLRMTGGLGPLQAMPVTGVLTITLNGEGGGTRLTASYAVAGPELASMAMPVDQVLGGQFSRLKAAAER